jgi:hypothetical protein
MRLATLSVAGIGYLLLAGLPSGGAVAHHSFAMFETDVVLTLEGTVDEFLWTNPHSWISVVVENEQGEDEGWAIEMGGPGGLARAGWSAATLSPGMPVSLVVRPHRDGSLFAQFMAITLPDGTQLGNPNAPLGSDAGGLPPR